MLRSSASLRCRLKTSGTTSRLKPIDGSSISSAVGRTSGACPTASCFRSPPCAACEWLALPLERCRAAGATGFGVPEIPRRCIRPRLPLACTQCAAGRMPATNCGYWGPKLEANKLRDQRKARALRRLGWRVLTVWKRGLKTRRRLQRTAAALAARIRCA